MQLLINYKIDYKLENILKNNFKRTVEIEKGKKKGLTI